MFSPLRNRFGIPGVISVIALVFAMLGGAYAASDNGSGNATASAKAKKGPPGPRGKRGKTGPAGPAGPQGPAGPAGAKGDNGTNGQNGEDGLDGADGDDGTNGKNVEVGTAGAECPNGGATVQVAGEPSTKKAVCNGEDGEGGEGGGFPETLPAGKTETGAWTLVGNNNAEGMAAFGWSIPLTPADAAAITVHFTDLDGDATCTGTINEPTAPAGKLCMYESPESNLGESPDVYPPDFSEGEGAPKVGIGGALLYNGGLSATEHALGTFAITAPAAP